jgi:hypothetical protein
MEPNPMESKETRLELKQKLFRLTLFEKT